ncbi:nucleotidyltransferase family protein [Paenibacillus albiflavus]|uniref:Nucleotidyltransferase family protein n=1 Tax=Paenibacillus albiflavus TaxID=2545760 RepID=A0A4R4EN43_9BACL|nr:nucleotidyltransferase family protein [Paenibacillus albiflavus]TCZ81003.1 nucleotidyltransferase family protein [Paenibacillus albiflavus]
MQSNKVRSKYDEEFLALIRNNREIMRDLERIRELKMPESYIAAGYIRNYIWDHIHGYVNRTPLNDIDVIYYDPEQLDEVNDLQYEQMLIEQTGNPIWSVKNQARMHIGYGIEPYTGIENAISRWPENVTGIAIRLEEDDRITYLCPHGLDDIFECRVRQSPFFHDRAKYENRVSTKNWIEIWPKLQIE